MGKAERYALKRVVRVGQKWEFDLLNTMRQRNVFTSQDGAVQTFERDVSQHRKGTVEVLTVKDGELGAIHVHFDDDCSDSAMENGERRQIQFTLAGQTAVAAFDPQGNVVYDAPLDPAAASEMAGMLRPSNPFYPTEPVAVRDVWKVDPLKVARQFDLGPQDMLELSCRFMAIDAIDDRNTAKIKLTGTVEKNTGGMLVKMTIGGFAQLDLISGESLQDEVIGLISTSGTTTQPGSGGNPVVLTVAGDGKFTAIGKRRILVL